MTNSPSIKPPPAPFSPPRCEVCGVVGGLRINACGHAMSDDEAQRRLRGNALRERGGLDPLDQFLIAFVALLGVETVDRYLTGTADPRGDRPSEGPAPSLPAREGTGDGATHARQEPPA